MQERITELVENNGLSQEQATIVAKAEETQAKKAQKALEKVSKYPHAIINTLTHDPVAKKNKVQIECVECGDTTRWVYTSDLFQVRHCTECGKKAKAEKAKQKAAETKAALEAYRASLKD